MTKRITGAAALAFAAFIVTACDDRPVPPASLQQATTAAANDLAKIPKPPTTQELLTGHRTRMALIPLPLTMEVPESWGKNVRLPMPNLLQGFTPNGEVQIQLTPRASLKPEALDVMINAAKKEQASNPGVVKVEVREMGNFRVMVRQKIGPPAPFITYDSNNQPHESMESNFNWTVSALIPSDGAFQVHELNFIGLTKSQYDKDKDFLEAIVRTLQYAGNGHTDLLSTTPAATTLP